MKQTLEDLLVKYKHPIIINCDNTSSINMSKNPIMHSKKKHIPIKYHFLREQVSQKVVKLEYVDTKEQVADIFPKTLPKESFEHFRQMMGVIPFQKLQRRKHNLRGGYDDKGICQKEERQEILNGIAGYPLSLLSKGKKVQILPPMPKGDIVENISWY